MSFPFSSWDAVAVSYFKGICTTYRFASDRKSSADEKHAMPAMLFKASLTDSYALTNSYLVTALSLTGIIAILHCCMYQQLYGTSQRCGVNPNAGYWSNAKCSEA